MSIGILGGGFGLYGYLAAACELDWRVHTLTKYKEILKSRTELSSHLNSLTFHETENELLTSVDCVVCARDAQSQLNFISTNTSFNGHLFLEKPLAPNLQLHKLVLENFNRDKKNFSIGYLFQFTRWHQMVLSIFANDPNASIKIDWKIRVHTTDWKQNISKGGGLFNYYALHFGSLLQSVASSSKDVNVNVGQQHVVFIVKKSLRNILEINISQSESDSFIVTDQSNPQNPAVVFDMETPFGIRSQIGKRDQRVDALQNYLIRISTQYSFREHVSLEEFILDLREIHSSIKG